MSSALFVVQIIASHPESSQVMQGHHYLIGGVWEHRNEWENKGKIEENAMSLQHQHFWRPLVLTEAADWILSTPCMCLFLPCALNLSIAWDMAGRLNQKCAKSKWHNLDPTPTTFVITSSFSPPIHQRGQVSQSWLIISTLVSTDVYPDSLLTNPSHCSTCQPPQLVGCSESTKVQMSAR